MFNDHGLVTWVCLPATSLPYTDKKYVFININKHNYSNDTYLRNIDSENKKPVQMGRRATRAGQRSAAARRISLFTGKMNKKDFYKTKTGEQGMIGPQRICLAPLRPPAGPPSLLLPRCPTLVTCIRTCKNFLWQCGTSSEALIPGL